MCMIMDQDKVLVQNRTKNDWPGITFPGGKVEAKESIYESCVREVKEETGLDVSNLELCGMIHYELEKKQERWIMYLYRTSTFSGTLLAPYGEDEVYWMDYKDLANAPLSNDLDIYLKVYEDESIQEAYAGWEDNRSTGFVYY